MKPETGELLVAVNARDPEEVRVALARGGRLLELRRAAAARESRVGNVYLGVVTQVEPGLDAAFVDYGDRRAGFLHAGNLHPALAGCRGDALAAVSQPLPSAELPEEGEEERPPAVPARAGRPVEEVLAPGDRILVQVLRDPVRGKGATLTTLISLPGRLLVWMPSLGRHGVSRRIAPAPERERLRELLDRLDPDGAFGLIARTGAAGAGLKDLRKDLRRLRRAWERLGEGARKAAGPCLLYAEESALERAVRDLFRPDLDRILVDDAELRPRLEDGLRKAAPGLEVPVESWDRTRPLFEALDLERDYQALFRPRVPFGAGASLVIQATEALTAVDVNSGRIGGERLEETALEANLQAAREIARQIRLRDLGGIIVVDFIDLREPAHRRRVEEALREALLEDRARWKLGRLGSFGLLALTRRRLGTGMPGPGEEPCPHCGGSGSLLAAHAGALRLLRRLRAAAAGPRAPAALRARAAPPVLEILHTEHQAALESLEAGLRIESREDPGLSPSDPVVERL